MFPKKTCTHWWKAVRLVSLVLGSLCLLTLPCQQRFLAVLWDTWPQGEFYSFHWYHCVYVRFPSEMYTVLQLSAKLSYIALACFRCTFAFLILWLTGVPTHLTSWHWSKDMSVYEFRHVRVRVQICACVGSCPWFICLQLLQWSTWFKLGRSIQQEHGVWAY